MATVMPVTLIASLDSTRHMASTPRNIAVSAEEIKSSLQPSVSTSQVEVNTPTRLPSSASNISVAKAATPVNPTQISANVKPASSIPIKPTTNTRPVTSNSTTSNPAASKKPVTTSTTVNKIAVGTGTTVISAPNRPIAAADPTNAHTTTSIINPKKDDSTVANTPEDTSNAASPNSLPNASLAKPVKESPLAGVTVASVTAGTVTAVTAAVGIADALVKITDSGKKIQSTFTGNPLPAVPSGNKSDATSSVHKLNAASSTTPTNMTPTQTASATQVSMCPGIPLLQTINPISMTPSTQFTATNAAQFPSCASYNPQAGHEVKYNYQNDQNQSSDEHATDLGPQEGGLNYEEQGDNNEHADQQQSVDAEQQASTMNFSENDEGYNDHGAEYLPVQDVEHHADIDREHENYDGREIEHVDDGQYEGEKEGQGVPVSQEGASEVQQVVEHEGAENFTDGDLGLQDDDSYEVIEEAQEGDIPYDGDELGETESYDAVEGTQVEIEDGGIHDVEEGSQINESEELNACEEDHDVDEDVDNEYDDMDGDDLVYD